MTKRHRRLVGLHEVSVQRANALEGQIAKRAAVVEKGLMAKSGKLRDRLRREPSEFKQRRLEAAYLQCMHDLAQVRRCYALAVKTSGQGGKKS